MHVSLLLEMAASGDADRVAVCTERMDISYGELLERAERTATWLRSRSIEYVALLDENSEAVPALIFGAAIAGVTFAPLNYRLADERLAAILDRLAPAVIVTSDDAAARVGAAPGLEAVTRSRFLEETAELERCSEPGGDADDVAIVLFTSGTAGEPKSAILRHRHLVSYVLSTVEFMAANRDEAALVSVPPYHIAGVSAVMTSVYGGRRLVYLRAFDPGEWIRVARKRGITHAMLVPTMLARILDVLEGQAEALPSMRHIACGGGRMPLPVIERALTLLPEVEFVNAYGLTETSSTVSVLGPEDHRAAFTSTDPRIARRLGSVGRPLPGVELVIRGEDGAPVGAETPGHVWVRGDQVSGEYAGSDEVGDDGWFATKDIGWVDAEGYLFLEGRADDVIVRGGENLSPGEIEDALIAHPKVAEAAVIGLPSIEWGQVPIAVVVPVARDGVPSEVEICDWVRARLRGSRVPARVVFADALPYTDTGKLLRRRVREQLLAEAPLADHAPT